MKIATALQRVVDKGYFVQNVFQVHHTLWEVTLRSPFDWYYRQGKGSTLAEALDKAARATLKPRPVIVPAKHAKPRVRLAVRLGRVRL